MKKYIPDTNVFLRFILNDIPSQAKKAEDIFQKAKNGKIEIFVPQIVIFEIHFVLEKYYQLTKVQTTEKIKAILSAEYLKVESKEIFLKAIDRWADKNISFPDAYLISAAENLQAEFYSFDRKLEN